MASLSVRRLDGEVIRRLKVRAQRDGLSVEETVRRILAAAVADEEPAGAMIRRIVGDDGVDFDLPAREVDEPIDFTSSEYGLNDPAGHSTRGRQGADGSLSAGSSRAVRPVSATGGRSGNSTTRLSLPPIAAT